MESETQRRKACQVLSSELTVCKLSCELVSSLLMSLHGDVPSPWREGKEEDRNVDLDHDEARNDPDEKGLSKLSS